MLASATAAARTVGTRKEAAAVVERQTRTTGTERAETHMSRRAAAVAVTGG
jgi:hypothetical protein